MANQKRKFILFENGKEYEVKDETSRYWICKGTQFKKSNPKIVDVREEAVKTPAPKKKQVKKAEEVEVATDNEYESEFDNIPDVSDILEEKVEV